jgi:aminoglycoside 6-adenylyltransferase
MWARWYGEIVGKFRQWAESEPDVEAALIVGSQARSDMPADQWSDLDLVIFHKNPPQLLASTDWFRSFGEVVLSTIEPTAFDWSRERRVLYSDGRDVDFSVFPPDAISFLSGNPDGQAILRRGFVVLIDKSGRLAGLETIAGRATPASGGAVPRDAYLSAVSDFEYHVLWVAKKLRRGELWAAKFGCDGYLKRLLLQMIEWGVEAPGAARVDVWHEGRFLDRWAPSDVRARLPSTFARYESQDIARAVRETARLYSDLARRVAERSGWSFPEAAHDSVAILVERTLLDLPAARL